MMAVACREVIRTTTSSRHKFVVAVDDNTAAASTITPTNVIAWSRCVERVGLLGEIVVVVVVVEEMTLKGLLLNHLSGRS